MISDITQEVIPITALPGLLSELRKQAVNNLVEEELPQFSIDLEVLRGQINTATSQINTTADEVQTNTLLTAQNALLATGTANNKGAWNLLTGSLNIPAAVNHNGSIWILNTNIADVTLSEPTPVNTDWTESSGITQQELDTVDAKVDTVDAKVDTVDAKVDTNTINKTNVPINVSGCLGGGSFIIDGSGNLIASGVIGSISNGYSATGSIVNNERFTLDGIITPANGYADGDNYLKTTASGTVTSTLVKPLYGEVSVSGDYYLNGLLYNSSGVAYSPQQTYLSENGKLLKVTASGGVPATITLEDDAPSIIEKCIKVDTLIGSGVLSFNNFFHAQDQKPSGTNGGTFTSGSYQTRDLNTILINNIIGASLLANQITLPAGSYIIMASAPARLVYQHKTRIQNVTDAINYIGTSETASPANDFTSRSIVTTPVITIASSKVFELQHRCGTTAGGGFGAASSFGDAEVYSDIKIWKVG